MGNAYRLLRSKEPEAFDLEREPKRIGMIRADSVVGAFLARRLVESGARFVEVTTEHVPFLNSDTHAEGHSTTEGLHAESINCLTSVAS